MGGLRTIKKDMENYINRILGNINIHIIGTLEIIKKGLEKCVDRIQGTTSISELQKMTILGTAHILRKVLSIK